MPGCVVGKHSQWFLTMTNKDFGRAAIVSGSLTAVFPTLIFLRTGTYLFVVPLFLGILSLLLRRRALRTKGNLSKRLGWVAAGCVVTGVFLPVGIMSCLEQSGDPIVLIIPEGYRGEVRLLIDKQQGVDVPLTSGRHIYQVPESGVLQIKDASPFLHWHTLGARYTNGKAILIDYDAEVVASLHSLGSGVRTHGGKVEEYFLYFVGTKAELRKQLNARQQ